MNRTGRLARTCAAVTALWLLAGVLWAGDVYWIDVRTAEEFSAGHVDGAVNIPYEEIVDRIGEVTSDKDSSVYLYCRSGRRSGIAMNALREAGYRNTVNIGGLEEAGRKASETPDSQNR
jgi:phage shock protein E